MGLVRTSFIIAPNGRVAAVLPARRIGGHAEQVLQQLAEFCGQWKDEPSHLT